MTILHIIIFIGFFDFNAFIFRFTSLNHFDMYFIEINVLRKLHSTPRINTQIFRNRSVVHYEYL